MSNKLLTIGMATYDDFHGVYFSLQALRMYHTICGMNQVEFVILDNNPNSNHGRAIKDFVTGWVGNDAKYIPYEEKSSSFNKYKIVDYASGEYVLIMDCHVLLQPNSLDYLLEYYINHPNCKDLIQGPLWYDDLKNYSTEFSPQWRDSMYGTWHNNQEAYLKNEPFEIPLQGMGLCSFKKSNWPGISPHFRGFGAEEGYIAEKFRRNGGKNICLPQLKWVHRFGRPEGVPFPLKLDDRIFNYFVGWLEITKDINHEMVTGTYEHFKDKIPKENLDALFEEAKNKAL
jgi:glycosyltransferase involved in cell wall biosynthesis